MRILSTIFSLARASWAFPADVKDPNRLILPFVMQTQIMDNWCWAAVASSIVFYFDDESIWSQPELVAKAFGFAENDEPDQSWDREFQIGTALGFVDCLRREQAGQIDFSAVLHELQRGRPVCLHIDWNDESGHAVAITGCWIDHMGLKHYRVDDPGLRDGEYEDEDGDVRDIPERHLARKYGWTGTWRHTFFIQEPLELGE